VNLKRVFIIFIIAFLLLPISGISQQTKGVLDPENDNEARLNRLQPPEKVMDAVGIAPGMVLAEIGAGRGRYVVQLAVRVGETGKVYAEDIDAAALKHLENRCEKWGLFNVETILGDVRNPKLPVEQLDLIFVISSYHHFKDPIALMHNARSALKTDGRLAIVEWLPWDKNDREGTKPEDIEAQMKAAGYGLISTERLEVAKPLNIYIFRSFEAKAFDAYLKKVESGNEKDNSRNHDSAVSQACPSDLNPPQIPL
jgi:ubiquinone/menaquinone biosynthesis C-methylase UbiE